MKRRIMIGATIVAATAVALTGCSTADPGSSSAASSGPFNITVGVGNPMAVLPLGSTTFSSDAVKITQKTSSPGGVTALLLNGQAQLATTDPESALIAIAKGVPLEIVATSMTSGTNTNNDLTGLLVNPKAGITSVKDLSGKTIAVPILGGGAQMGAEAGIDQLGGDSKSVKFVELPPANLVPGVVKGTVAATVTQEPAITLGKEQGLVSLFAPAVANAPTAPVNVYIATRSFVSEHKDVVDAFITALSAASAQVKATPDDTRAKLAKIGNLTTEQAKSMVLPIYTPNVVDVAKIKQLEKVMIKYGIISKEVDISTAVYSGK